MDTADAKVKSASKIPEQVEAKAEAAKAKAKYDELTKWVEFGEATLHNDWNTYRQPW